MIREDRYLTFKRADIMEGLTHHERITLRNLALKVEAYRERMSKLPLQCVCVESDWPEYEEVWGMIERRVDAAITASSEKPPFDPMKP